MRACLLTACALLPIVSFGLKSDVFDVPVERAEDVTNGTLTVSMGSQFCALCWGLNATWELAWSVLGGSDSRYDDLWPEKCPLYPYVVTAGDKWKIESGATGTNALPPAAMRRASFDTFTALFGRDLGGYGVSNDTWAVSRVGIGMASLEALKQISGWATRGTRTITYSDVLIPSSGFYTDPAGSATPTDAEKVTSVFCDMWDESSRSPQGALSRAVDAWYAGADDKALGRYYAESYTMSVSGDFIEFVVLADQNSYDTVPSAACRALLGLTHGWVKGKYGYKPSFGTFREIYEGWQYPIALAMTGESVYKYNEELGGKRGCPTMWITAKPVADPDAVNAHPAAATSNTVWRSTCDLTFTVTTYPLDSDQFPVVARFSGGRNHVVNSQETATVTFKEYDPVYAVSEQKLTYPGAGPHVTATYKFNEQVCKLKYLEELDDGIFDLTYAEATNRFVEAHPGALVIPTLISTGVLSRTDFLIPVPVIAAAVDAPSTYTFSATYESNEHLAACRSGDLAYLEYPSSEFSDRVSKYGASGLNGSAAVGFGACVGSYYSLSDKEFKTVSAPASVSPHFCDGSYGQAMCSLFDTYLNELNTAADRYGLKTKYHESISIKNADLKAVVDLDNPFRMYKAWRVWGKEDAWPDSGHAALRAEYAVANAESKSIEKFGAPGPVFVPALGAYAVVGDVVVRAPELNKAPTLKPKSKLELNFNSIFGVGLASKYLYY